LFVIKKEEKFIVKQLSAEGATASLYKEIITPVTLTSVDEKEVKIKKSAFCFKVIKSIPLYELYFDQEGEFWNDLIHMQWSKIDGEQLQTRTK
jgi:hypothetical protein